MKRILLFLLLINSISIFSQDFDKITPNAVFNKNNFKDIIKPNLDSNFVRGWNWDKFSYKL